MKSALKILGDTYGHSGYRLWVLMVLLLLVGISDGTSMALLYPVLDLVGMGAGTSDNHDTVGATFRWLFAQAGIEPTLVNVSLVFIGSVLIQGLLFTTQNWLLLDLQKKYVASWQKRLFNDFTGAEWAYCASQKTSEIVNLILTEVGRLGAALFSILQLIVTAVVLLVYLVISLFVSWKLTICLLGLGMLLFALMWPIRRATQRYGAEFEIITADLTSVLTEMLWGAKFVKATAGVARANHLVANQIDRLRHNLTWSAFLPTTIRSGFEFAGMLIILGALVYGLKVEHMTPAELVVLIGLMARLFPRLMHVQLLYSTLNLSTPSYEVLRRAHSRFSMHPESRRSGAIVNLERILPATIRGERLVVRYGDKVVLHGVDFVIPAGQVIGFCGPSGAGKSTLVDVLIGLNEPSSGQIRIGDIGLKTIDIEAWRRKIGYVSQDTFLFHDTIANNIRWSTPAASAEAVVQAVRAAGLDTFVSSLPEAYDTIVGDRGVKLSGGQRQRISIARALVHQPTLLVLDEATSALDSVSEQEVMNVIQQLRGKMTIVIVAHRLSAVRNADLIYVLDHGRIAEHGSWSSLSGQRALFHRLMQAQAIPEHN